MVESFFWLWASLLLFCVLRAVRFFAPFLFLLLFLLLLLLLLLPLLLLLLLRHLGSTSPAYRLSFELVQCPHDPTRADPTRPAPRREEAGRLGDSSAVRELCGVLGLCAL